MSYSFRTVFSASPRPLGQGLAAMQRGLARYGYRHTVIASCEEDQPETWPRSRSLDTIGDCRKAATQFVWAEPAIDTVMWRTAAAFFVETSISSRWSWWQPDAERIESYRDRMVAIASAVEADVACGAWELSLEEGRDHDLFLILLENPQYERCPCSWGLLSRAYATRKRRAALARQGFHETDRGAYRWYEQPDGLL